MEKKLNHIIKKSLLILCALIFIANLNAHADSHWLKSFYEAYMANIVKGEDNDDLCRMYMQEGLMKKLRRVSVVTGVDAVIRGQDVNEDAMRTLSVLDLDNGWHIVGYRWNEDRSETEIRIPVKSTEKGDSIAYIVPIWNGEQYGDELIYKGNGRINVVDNTTGMEFMETFYRKYLSIYYSMLGNIEKELSDLRSEYLTDNALAQCHEAAAVNAGDGYAGYDMLVGNYDFDYSWSRSVTITEEAGDIYKFIYDTGSVIKSLILLVEKVNGSFRIGSIVKN